MKKLLFNGCSFVAGDALVWDQYTNDTGYTNRNWNSFVLTDQYIKTPNRIEYIDEYKNVYRKKFNLPSLVASILNTEAIDISEDGFSNDSISLTTIFALSKIPQRERQNYHVVIGWSSLYRLLKYSKTVNAFVNLSNNDVKKFWRDPTINELHKYVYAGIVENYQEDIILNYTKNIVMLESFLKSNNCSYTFYRSLGTTNDSEFLGNISWPFFSKTKQFMGEDVLSLTDDKTWCDFLNFRPCLFGESVCSEFMDDKSNWICKENPHPNMQVVDSLSFKLANFIKNQNIGF
jgi:hypothetical protein